MLIGYARVSTTDQTLALQQDTLQQAGCSKIFTDTASGALAERKGLADVFAAMRLLDRSDVELIVMGAPLVPMEFYRREFPRFIHEPPRSHARVLALMETCDALVLPSIVEGRALVQQEALSRGLPLIVTANAGGEDLIAPGETGWLVPMRDPAALAERIAWLADHREVLPEMQRAAQRMAIARTWDDYTRKIIAALDAPPPAELAYALA